MDLNTRENLRAEFRKQQLIELQNIQESFASLVGDEALPALALAPYWPLELADKSLPISGDVKTTLEQAVEDHMVQTGKGPYPWRNDVIFWMEPPTRTSMLQRLLAYRKVDFLKQQLAVCGSRMLSAGGAKLKQDLPLFRWAQLASAAATDEGFESFLMSQIETALRESEKAEQLASPEALRWIEASESLGEVLRGGFEAAVAAATRRFELFHLLSHDRLKLRNYYVRNDLDQAFFDLLDDPGHWAVHFIGQGGAGKTMLIRHIKIHRPSKSGRPANVAFSRVDFDYLNPDYPERNPALLLEALAAEFRLAAGPDSQRAFASFQDRCKAIHRKVEGAAWQGQERRVSPKDPEFQEALRHFAAALSTLEGRRSPVIILDTCEELVKSQRRSRKKGSEQDEWPRNVRDTFEILEDLQEMLPDLRVIFSGRRPLPDKPYLRVHEIQGFSERETHEFLTVYRSEDGRPIPAALVPEIIKLARSEQTGQRYNPYDLDTYAKWVSADDKLTAERLAVAGPQTYIKERIVDRLNPMVRGILPALAILGRFDLELLKELIEPSLNGAQDLAEVLSQEWMQPDAGTADTWRLDALFRERLLQYYGANDRAVSHAASTKLAEILPDKTLTRPFSQLTPQIFAACLGVLGENPVKAAEWWEKVENRIAALAQWPWAEDMFGFVELDRSGRDPLAAALFATRAAVSLHTGAPDVKGDWEEVLDSVSTHPTVHGQNRLRFRAECGLEIRLPLRWIEPLSLQDAACLLAAVEAKIEAGEPPDSSMTEALTVLEGVAAPDLQAFAKLLKARLAAHNGDIEEAGRAFEEALRTCKQGFDERQIWLHWIRPDTLEHRILLEFARALPDRFLERQTTDDSLFRHPLRTIDSDRLASVWLNILEKRTAFSSNPRRQGFLAQYTSSLDPGSERPRCRAHREFPPFFVRLLEARAMAGEVEEARLELQRLSQADLDRSADVAFAIDVAMTRIIRRMRLVSEGLHIPKTLQSSGLPGWVSLARITESFFSSGDDLHDLSVADEDELGIAELAFLRNERDCPEKTEAAYRAARARSDDLGCLQARLLQALWFARKGNHREAKRAASSAEPHYKELLKRIPRLPLWEHVVAAAETGTASILLNGMNPKPSVWRPWVVRLLACLTPPPRADLLQWLLANDVSVVDGKRYLATELVFVNPKQSATVGPAAASPASSRSPLQGLKFVGAFLLGLAVTVGAVLFLYRLYESGLNTAGISITQTWLRVAIFIALLVLVPYGAARIPKVLGAFAKLYARWIRVQFEVSYEETPKDINKPFGSPAVLRYRTFLLGWVIHDWRELRFRSSEETAYAPAAWDALQAREARSISRWVRWSFRTPCGALLVLDEASAGTPWETLQVVISGIPFSQIPLFIRRSTRQRKVTSTLSWRAPVDVLTWGSPTVWQSHPDWSVNFRATFAGTPEEFDRQRDDVGILRVVGSPVESTAGLILRVVSASHARYLNVQSSQSDESYTVRPGDLAARYPSLRFCMVQLPPGEIRDRLSTDRRDSALLKRIGAEIFSSGAPAVLVVPVLSTEACDELLNAIAKVIAARPENAVETIERALVSFRRGWVNKFAPKPEDAEEIAADICLYAHDKVSFRLES